MPPRTLITPIRIILKGIDLATPVIRGISNALEGAAVAGFKFASSIANIVSPDLGELLGQLTSVNGLYDLFVGQNVRLQQELLSTQAVLAGTNKILQNGIEVKDPTEQIKALEGPVQQAVERIRQGSLELVGVTSSQLIPLLQLTAGQAANIGANLDQCADLVLSFSASFQVLGIPIEQARQEVNSILTGTIDMNSSLAKSLALTNDQVNNWKSQGVLVDKLNERLSAFRASNKIAAQTIEGVASNIAELFQIITLNAGKDLIKPIVTGLNGLYEYLQANQGNLEAFFQKASGAIQSVIENLGEAGKALYDAFGPGVEGLVGNLGDLLINLFQAVGIGIANIIQAVVALNEQFPLISDAINRISGALGLAAEGYEKIINLANLASGKQAESDQKIIQLTQQRDGAFKQYLDTLQETQKRLGELQGKQRQGQELTEAEKKELADLQARRSEGAGKIREFAGELDKANVVGGENQATLKGMKTEAASWINKLTETKIVARDLSNLGSSFTQLEAKAAAAARTIKEGGGGDSAKFNEAGKQLIDLTKQQIEAGLITQDEAKKRLEQVATDGRFELAQQQAAQKAITELIKTESEKRIEDSKSRQADIDTQAAKGTISEAKAAELTTKVKGEQLQLQLQQIKAAKAEEDKIREEALKKDLAALDAQVTGAADRLEALKKKRADTKDPAESAELDQKIKSATEDVTKAEEERTKKSAELTARNSAAKIESDRKASNQEKQVAAEIAKNEAENRKRRNEERLKDFDEEKTQLESQRDRKLLSDRAFQEKSLALSKRRADEELKQIADKRAKLAPDDKEGQEALATREAEVRSRLAKEVEQIEEQKAKRITDTLKNQQTIEESLRDRKLISEQEFIEKSLQLSQKQADAELADLERQKKKLAPGDTDGLADIQAKEAEVRGRLAKQLEQIEEQKAKRITDTLKNQQTIEESLRDRKLISEQEFIEKSLQLSQKQADAELADLERQKKKLAPGDTDGLADIQAKEAEVRGRLAKQVEQLEQEKSQKVVAAITARQKIQDAALAQGNITEAQYAQESLSLTQERLAAELAEIQRQKAKVKATDIEALTELAGKEAEIRKQQVEALEQYQQRQIEIIERAQRKAQDIIKASEQERLTEIQKLENSNDITRAQAEQLRVNSTGDRLKKELELQREQVRQLEALPQLSDPVKEEERQAKIRGLRLQASELVKQQLENEAAKQEATTRVISEQIDRRLAGVKNLLQVQEQGLQREAQLQDAVTKSLENQSKLLNAKKELATATSSYAEGELQLLSQLTTDEGEKKKLAEQTAQIKLKSLQTQQALERQVLEINLQQQAAALEKEKIQNRIAQLQNRSEVLQAKADLSKTLARDDATAEEIEAARLNVSAKEAQGVALKLQSGLLDQTGALQEKEAQVQRFTQSQQQTLALDQARAEFAKVRADNGSTKEQAALLAEIRDKVPKAVAQVDQVQKLVAPDANIRPQAVPVPTAATFELPKSLTYAEAARSPREILTSTTGDSKELVAAIARLEKAYKGGGAPISPKIDRIENKIENHFENAADPQAIADQIKQQSINTQYEILQKLQQRKQAN